MVSSVGVHHSAGASSVQSNRVRSAPVAMGRVDQKIESASVRVDISSMSALPEVQDVQETRRRDELGDRSIFKAIELHVQAPSPRINAAALPQRTYMAALEGGSQAGYSPEYLQNSQPCANPNPPSNTKLSLPALNLSWGMGSTGPGLEPFDTLIPDSQSAIDFGFIGCTICLPLTNSSFCIETRPLG